MSFYTIVEMSACVTYMTRIADLQLVALFPSHLKFLFNFPAHKHRLDGGVYF